MKMIFLPSAKFRVSRPSSLGYALICQSITNQSISESVPSFTFKINHWPYLRLRKISALLNRTAFCAQQMKINVLRDAFLTFTNSPFTDE